MAFQQYNVYDGLTACRVVATSNQSGTYVNGQLNNGVGATFTYATGALTIDSVLVEVGDSVMLMAQTNGWENGIYVVTNAGATGVSAVLQRRGDMQCIEQIRAGQYVSVGAGSINAGNIYTVVEPLPAHFGIDALVINADPSAGGVAFSGPASTANALVVFSNTAGDIKAASTTTTLGQSLNITGALGVSGAISSTAGPITSGSSGDAGSFISFPATAANGTFIFEALNAGGVFNTTVRNSIMGQSSVISIPDPGAATANFILDTSSGTQSMTGALTVAGAIASTAGNITSGSSGDAGTFISFPATGANGTLILAAVNAGGAFNMTISNGTLGQSSVMTVPDPANALGRFLVGATATPFVSGNFPVASGTGGLMIDSGVALTALQLKANIKAATTANIGGAGAGPISVAVAGLTAASVVVGTIESSSNAVQVQTITATGTGFDVTFSGDPGATCLLNYVAFIAAQ